MTQNTRQHSADAAKFISFDPKGTRYPANVLTVQHALSLTSPTINATETQAGVAEIATKEEIDAGQDHSRIVTPKMLEYRMQRPEATETVKGIAALATQQEALAGVVQNKIITPHKLILTFEHYFTNRTARESANGVLKLSTTAAAVAGTDDTTAMTPLKTKQAIAAATANIVNSPATETAMGLVQLANVAQVNAGTLREGYAISPYTFSQLNPSTTSKGIGRIATIQEARLGDSDALLISAKAFKTYNANIDNFGTVKLHQNKSNEAGGALAANANVVFTTGDSNITGNVAVTGSLKKNGHEVLTTADGGTTPIGTVVMYAGTTPPNGWMFCDGRAISKTQYSTLYSVIGDTYSRTVIIRGSTAGDKEEIAPGRYQYVKTTKRIIKEAYTVQHQSSNGRLFKKKWTTTEYRDKEITERQIVGTSIEYTAPGVTVDTFALPDLRGMFVRGPGRSHHIENFNNPDSKGKQGLGWGCTGGSVGSVQHQTIAKHKHISSFGEHWRERAAFGSGIAGGKMGSSGGIDWDNHWYFTNDGSEDPMDPNFRDNTGTMNPEMLISDETKPWNMTLNYIIKVS